MCNLVSSTGFAMRLFIGLGPSGASLFRSAMLEIAAGQGQSAPNVSFSIWRTRTNDPEQLVTDSRFEDRYTPEPRINR